MTIYWKPNPKTGEVVYCDQHGCVLRNVPDAHSVANGNSVGKWECFNMHQILTDRMSDSHETAMRGVPDPQLFEWHWPPECSPLLLASPPPHRHEHDYSRAATHNTQGSTPRVYGSKWLRLLCCRHGSLPSAWSGIRIHLWIRVQHRLVSRSWSWRIACLVRLLNVTGGFTPSLSILYDSLVLHHTDMSTTTYKIVRFKYPNSFKPVRIIRTGLTLEQAQEHCHRPDTRGGEGETAWFDGYEKEEK